MSETHAPLWEIVEEKAQKPYLRLRAPDTRQVAFVWRDGRFHFAEADALSSAEMLNCDIDDLIARLQSLRAAAVEHFGPGWPA